MRSCKLCSKPLPRNWHSTRCKTCQQNKKRTENLTFDELRKLMSEANTFERRNGKVRQKRTCNPDADCDE